MDGDIAPLSDIFSLVDQYGGGLYVDDSHGTGVLGRGGKGAAAHFNLHGKIDVEMGTLSKALGSFGGFIAGSSDLCNWLRQRERSYTLSTSPPPSLCAASIAAIDLIENDPQMVTHLWSNAEKFRSGLREIGFKTGTSETPIIPVIIGETTLAVKMSKTLFEEGIFAQSIIYPTVPKGSARLRVIVTAAHTPSELDQALSAFRKVGKKLSII
jgi:glycine C-acetyltransferase